MPESAEPRFGGSAVMPPPEVFEQARRSNPLWYQVLERAYADFAVRPENVGVYADPKSPGGATVQQAWLVYTLFGVEPYCLLAHALPAASTQRISRLVNCTAADVVTALKSIQAGEGHLYVALLYYDGRSGHTITLRTFDAARERFVYHDPWPEGSLLEKEKNAAGVDAQPEGGYWSVTASELERVAFAAFVFPAQWARLQGQAADLLFEQWQEGEFFKFFHLKALGEQMEGEVTQRLFAPGPFRDEVQLLIESTATGRIARAFLSLDRDWMLKNFMLALDITKSFISCFAPAPERGHYEQVAAALWQLRDPAQLMKLKDADPDQSSAMKCVHAFMGASEGAQVSTDLARFAIGMVKQGERALQQIEFVLR